MTRVEIIESVAVHGNSVAGDGERICRIIGTVQKDLKVVGQSRRGCEARLGDGQVAGTRVLRNGYIGSHGQVRTAGRDGLRAVANDAEDAMRRICLEAAHVHGAVEDDLAACIQTVHFRLEAEVDVAQIRINVAALVGKTRRVDGQVSTGQRYRVCMVTVIGEDEREAVEFGVEAEVLRKRAVRSDKDVYTVCSDPAGSTDVTAIGREGVAARGDIENLGHHGAVDGDVLARVPPGPVDIHATADGKVSLRVDFKICPRFRRLTVPVTLDGVVIKDNVRVDGDVVRRPVVEEPERVAQAVDGVFG